MFIKSTWSPDPFFPPKHLRGAKCLLGNTMFKKWFYSFAANKETPTTTQSRDGWASRRFLLFCRGPPIQARSGVLLANQTGAVNLGLSSVTIYTENPIRASVCWPRATGMWGMSGHHFFGLSLWDVNVSPSPTIHLSYDSNSPQKLNEHQLIEDPRKGIINLDKTAKIARKSW